MLLDVCSTCRYPNAVYADDVAGPLVPEPDREQTKPDWSDIFVYETLSDDGKQAAAGERLLHLCALLRLHPRVPGVRVLGQVRQPLAHSPNW